MFGRRKKDPAPAPAAAPAPPPPSAADIAKQQRRENDRMARSAARDSDRQIRELKAQEVKLKQEMKSLARAGKVTEARILAKNLAQNQKFQQQAVSSKYQVGSMVTQANMMGNQQRIGAIMGDAAQMMARANASGNPAGMMQNVQQYQMETAKMEMNGEMMDDVLEDAFGGQEVDEEADNILGEVLAEAGLETGSKIGAAGVTPSAVPANRVQEDARLAQENDEIQRRLAALGPPPSGGR